MSVEHTHTFTLGHILAGQRSDFIASEAISRKPYKALCHLFSRKSLFRHPWKIFAFFEPLIPRYWHGIVHSFMRQIVLSVPNNAGLRVRKEIMDCAGHDEFYRVGEALAPRNLSYFVFRRGRSLFERATFRPLQFNVPGFEAQCMLAGAKPGALE